MTAAEFGAFIAANTTDRRDHERRRTEGPMKRALAAIACWLAGLSLPAAAQNAPTPREIEIYAGLHEAAAKGDVAEIEKLITDGEKPNIQDSKSRTPLHVAVYLKQQARRGRCSSSAPIRMRWRSTATTSSPSRRWPTTSTC